MLCRGTSRLPLSLLLTIIIGTAALPAAVARAAFEVVAHDAFVDPVARRTTFTVTFNDPPDFSATNDLGQPMNAFQFFCDADLGNDDGEIGFAGADVVIIRGAEIRFANTIPIRDSLNPSGKDFPNAEGWGAVLGESDFTLDGATLSFTTSWDVLRETDGRFGYRLFGLEAGELTSEVTFVTNILVPLPAPICGTAGLLVLVYRCVPVRTTRD